MIRSVIELDIPVEVKSDIEMIINTLLRKFSHNINKILLFGSYATGTYQPDSDIDIVTVLNEFPDIRQRRMYKQAVDIDRDVDLIFCSKEQFSSGISIYRHINEKGVILYERL